MLYNIDKENELETKEYLFTKKIKRSEITKINELLEDRVFIQ